MGLAGETGDLGEEEKEMWGGEETDGCTARFGGSAVGEEVEDGKEECKSLGGEGRGKVSDEEVEGEENVPESRIAQANHVLGKKVKYNELGKRGDKGIEERKRMVLENNLKGNCKECFENKYLAEKILPKDSYISGLSLTSGIFSKINQPENDEDRRDFKNQENLEGRKSKYSNPKNKWNKNNGISLDIKTETPKIVKKTDSSLKKKKLRSKRKSKASGASEKINSSQVPVCKLDLLSPD
ncbi:unnamed protein product [Moneuplotes crassus]|uniref:Uncharacterized protein n=1 Tax=Euplotes crassus TaxID=5936 RepID=A0AAD1UAJ1_EUPCR|nr:unnamed protein product [Moneuplotes crassus]